jgi:serine phosphatase RsbU (regulator of sigma subunit)/ligand-binding sensor domain-containing protein
MHEAIPGDRDTDDGIMNLKRIVLLCLCFLVLTLEGYRAHAQEGIPYLSNFNLPAGFNKQNWAIVQDDQGTLLLANRRGLTTFDGIRWKHVEIDIIPYSLAKDSITGRIFVGSDNAFGYLERNEINEYAFIKLSKDDSDYGTISDITITKEYVYFYSHRNITRIKREAPTEENRIRPVADPHFAGYAVLDTSLYVNIPETGLFKAEGSQLHEVPGGDVFDNVSVLFFIPLGDSRILIGTDNSFLYFFDGHEITDLIPEDEEYLFGAVITGGIALPDNELALTTLTGGCVIINAVTGKIRYRINYQSGLPDDEIYAITTDYEQGVWLTHESGASRVDLNLPIENYNTFSGLEGNLSEVITHKGTLYVSTSEGVYFLEPQLKYKETEVLMLQTPPPGNSPPQKVEITPAAKPEAELALSSTANDTIGEKSRFRRFFNRLFNREEPIESTEKDQPEKEEKLIEVPRMEIQQPRYVRKKVVRLESMTYVFTKVSGLNSKCRKLIEWNDRLLVATNTGLFEIKNGASSFIITDTYIHTVCPVPGHGYKLLAGTNTGLSLVEFKSGEFEVRDQYLAMQHPVYSIHVEGPTLWLGSDSRVTRVSVQNWETPVIQDEYELYTPYLEKVRIASYEDRPTFFIPSGIYQINESTGSLIMIQPVSPPEEGFYHYIFSPDGSIWIQYGQEWLILSASERVLAHQLKFLNLFDEIKFLNLDDENNLWIIDGHNAISKLKTLDEPYTDSRFEVFFSRISNHLGERFMIENLSLNPNQLPLEFSITAPFFLRADRSEFQYYLEGLDQPWSSWSTNQTIYIPYVPSGNYTLKIRARNVLGKESEIKSTSFYIQPPFTSTWPFYFIVGASSILMIILIIYLRDRKLIRDKKILELKVQDRTREIARQNEEISRQKEEITDSINYGERIQNATLPPKELLDTILPEYFILFKPRDIVSGDFYWVREKNGKIIIAVIDCTGHGVPGAFMSFLGYSLLSEIGNNYQVTTASAILNRLRTNLKHAFHQTNTKEEAADGMDMGLCILDPQSFSLQYAGAYNPLYLIRNGELLEFDGDKMPIGVHLREEKPFTNKRIQLEPGDTLYMFTDGFTDQFGGPQDKKYKIIPFQEILLRIQDENLAAQKEILDQELRQWMGDQEQVDDILVLGFRMSM